MRRHSAIVKIRVIKISKYYKQLPSITNSSTSTTKFKVTDKNVIKKNSQLFDYNFNLTVNTVLFSRF